MRNLIKLSAVLIGLVTLTISGCGKNTVGPTAPIVQDQVVVSQLPITPSTNLTNSTSLNEENVNASCSGSLPGKEYKYNFHKNRAKVRQYVNLNMKNWLIKFYIHLYCQWYNQFPVKQPFSKMLKSNFLFIFIVHQHQIDTMIGKKIMEILSQAWVAGDGTNPGEFNSEVTLTPYKWKSNGGFYGQLLPGWQVVPNSTDGYIFQTTNANNDLVYVDTKSYDIDIYKNNTDVRRFHWIYFHDPVDAGFYKIEFLIENQLSLERVKLDSKLFDLDGMQTSINLWNSVVNKSASYRIVTNDGNLDLNLVFDTTGTGGGSLDILNKNGDIDHYVYVMSANGHGYWTLNGGKKHYF